MSLDEPLTEERAQETTAALKPIESNGWPAERRLLPALVPALVSAVSGFTVLLVLGRQFGPGEFGAGAALMACAVILSVPGAIFQVARTPFPKSELGSSKGSFTSTPLSRTLGRVVAASFVLLGLTFRLDAFLHMEGGSSGLLAPYFFLSAMGGLAIGASRGRIGLRDYSGIVLARLLVGAVLAFLFVHDGLGAPGMLLGLGAGEVAVLLIVGMLSVAHRSDPRSPKTERRLLPDLLPRHAGLSAALVGGLWVLSHFDVVLARHYLSPNDAGEYAAAWALARALLGPIALVAIYSFRVSTRWTLAATDWLRRLLGITWTMSLISVVVLLAVRVRALAVVFGSQSRPAERLVPMAMLAMGFFVVAAVIAQFHVFARSRSFLLLIPVLVLQVTLASMFHAKDELIFVAALVEALAAGALYQAAMAISRWPQALGGLSPHEEFVPGGRGMREDQRQVELSIVLPCHNTGPALREFLLALQGQLDPRVPTEIVVVSDGSTDATVAIAGEFASRDLRVFHYPERLGKGHALRVGLHQAQGEYVAFIDSDGDIDPRAIVPFFSLMQLYQPDIVVASKRHPLSQVEYPGFRRLLSWVYHVIGRILFRINVSDTQTGLKLIRRDVLAAVLPKMLEKRYAFDLELLVIARRLGFKRIFEAPVQIRYRFTSNVNPNAAFRIVLDTLGIFYRRYVLNSYAPASPVVKPLPTASGTLDTAAQVALGDGPSEGLDQRSRPGPSTRFRRGLTLLARPWVGLAAMIALYVVVFGWLTWLQQSNFGTFGFDMGIFDQEIWLASHFKHLFITTRGLDMWANHVNPNVYLLAPFYWLGAGPHFLYLVQTVALALGAVPLWLLARDRFGHSWLSLGVPAAWLLYPSVQWMTWWHFHPESLAVTPLLFAWWLAGKRRWAWYAACVILVLAAKEDAALAVIALGIAVSIRSDRTVGVVTTIAALAWLMTSFRVIIPAAGTSTPFYADQFPALGTTMSEIVFNIFRHPSRLIRLALSHDRYDYYVKMLAPVAGVALLAPLVLVIAIPTVLENVANNQGYPHNYMFQYQALVSAGIFLAVVEAIGRLRRRGAHALLVIALIGSALASNVVWSPSPLDDSRFHSGIWAMKSSPHLAAMAQAVHQVPSDASVAASYTAVPHLTHRTTVYEWPNPWVRQNYGVVGTNRLPDPGTVNYIVLDTGLNPEQLPLFKQLTGVSGPFRILFDRDGAVVAKRVFSLRGE